MVERGQRLRLVPLVGRDLERHQPLHRHLPGQKDAAERPFAELDEQIEIVEPLAGREPFDAASAASSVWSADEIVGAHQPPQRVGRAGESDRNSRCGEIALPGRAADVDILVDQIARRLAVVAAARETRDV